MKKNHAYRNNGEIEHVSQMIEAMEDKYNTYHK